MRKVLLSAILFAATLATNTALAASAVTALFGSRVSENARFEAPYLTADLDGDGKADAIYLVSIAQASPRDVILSDVTIFSKLFHSQPLDAHGEKLALAIVLAKGNRKFLITGYEGEDVTDFFGSPIWGEKSVPLAVAKRGSRAFRSFQRQEKQIRNDVLVIGSEAGIDSALYWNGRAFALFEPKEEP
ncbi:MAG: hypothetical protein WAN65_28235 [Candidatus Sulfotelmatobacter sp.]